MRQKRPTTLIILAAIAFGVLVNVLSGKNIKVFWIGVGGIPFGLVLFWLSGRIERQKSDKENFRLRIANIVPKDDWFP